MSDVEKALAFIEQELDLSSATGMFRDDWEDWRRIEVLLKKLQRLENSAAQPEQPLSPKSTRLTPDQADAIGNNRRSG